MPEVLPVTMTVRPCILASASIQMIEYSKVWCTLLTRCSNYAVAAERDCALGGISTDMQPLRKPLSQS